MKPEALVPTQATCEAMRKAGYKQSTVFYWWLPTDHPPTIGVGIYPADYHDPPVGWGASVAAPLLQEILDDLGGIHKAFDLFARLAMIPTTYTSAFAEAARRYDFLEHIKNAEAAGLTWLKLHADGLIASTEQSTTRTP